jgi:hypothetical protein
MKQYRYPALALAVAAALGLCACGGGSGSSNSGSSGSGSTPTGTVNVNVMDAPTKDFDHVWVTIREIRFHTSNAVAANDPGWLSYPLATPVSVDLAALDNGSMSEVFAGLTPPAGTYQQIRFVLVSDAAPLSDSAVSAGLTYNDQVNYTDAAGASHVAALEIAAPTAGIGLNGTFTVTAATPLNLALDFDIGHDVVKFIHGGNNAFTLKPLLQYFDLSQSGAVNGQVDLTNVCSSTATAALTNCAYNLVIKSEQLSADGSHHAATRFTTIRPDGSFTLYPVRVPAGQTTTNIDVLVRGRNMDTILVRGVPVTAGSTPTSNAATVSALPLPLTIDTEYTANASTPMSPSGSWLNFFQTLTATGQSEVPYEVRYRHVDPFTGVFVDAIPLSTGPIQLGAYVAGGSPTLQANTPAQANGGFQVVASALDYTRAVDATILTSGAPSFSFAQLAVNPAVGVADSISGTIAQGTANQYDSGYLVVVRMGVIVQTLSISSVLTQNAGMGGAFTVANLPGGTATQTLPGAYYYLYARVWNSASPLTTTKRIDFSGFADLRTGSATGINVTL